MGPLGTPGDYLNDLGRQADQMNLFASGVDFSMPAAPRTVPPTILPRQEDTPMDNFYDDKYEPPLFH